MLSHIHAHFTPIRAGICGAVAAMVAAFAAAPLYAAPLCASLIGINLGGGEYGPVYNANTYYGPADLAYLESKGITLIRLPTCWQKLQPVLGQPLDPSTVSALTNFLTLGAKYHFRFIIDIHNYGRHVDNSGGTEAQQRACAATGQKNQEQGSLIGVKLTESTPGAAAPGVSDEQFADFWRRLATVLKNQPDVVGYGLMNEPGTFLPDNSDWGVAVWPQAAQAAIMAIRTVDMHTAIYISGGGNGLLASNFESNTAFPLSDPANKLVYEAHQYAPRPGHNIQMSYDQLGAYPNVLVDRIGPFVNWLHAHHQTGFLGEYGVPSNDPRYMAVMENLLNYLCANGVSSAYYSYLTVQPMWPVDPATHLNPWANCLSNRTNGCDYLNTAPRNSAGELDLSAPEPFQIRILQSYTLGKSSPRNRL